MKKSRKHFFFLFTHSKHIYSEPSTRGILIAYSTISAPFGMLIIYLLNTLMPWRSVALLCLTLPVITAIAICFVSSRVLANVTNAKKFPGKILLMIIVDSRNASVAPLKTSNGTCRKVAALASRLGFM